MNALKKYYIKKSIPAPIKKMASSAYGAVSAEKEKVSLIRNYRRKFIDVNKRRENSKTGKGHY